MTKLEAAADALIDLADPHCDEFEEGYVHTNLFLTKSDLMSIAEYLRELAENQMTE